MVSQGFHSFKISRTYLNNIRAMRFYFWLGRLVDSAQLVERDKEIALAAAPPSGSRVNNAW